MEEDIKIGFYYDDMEKMGTDIIFCQPTQYANYFTTRTNYNLIYSKLFGDCYIGNSKFLSSNGYLNAKVQEAEETEDGLMIRPILQMPDSFFNNLTYEERQRGIVKFGKYPMARVEDCYRIYFNSDLEFYLPNGKKIKAKKIKNTDGSFDDVIELSGTLFKVEDIEWYIDLKNKKLISVKGLLAGVPVTNMDLFIENYLLKDILKGTEYEIKGESENMKINEETMNIDYYVNMIDEISKSNFVVLLNGRREYIESIIEKLSPNIIVNLEDLTDEEIIGEEKTPYWLTLVKRYDEYYLFFDGFDLIDDKNKLHVINKINKKGDYDERSAQIPLDTKVILLNSCFTNVTLNEKIRGNLSYIEVDVDWLKWAVENNIHPLMYTLYLYSRETYCENKSANNSYKNRTKDLVRASNFLYKSSNPIYAINFLWNYSSREKYKKLLEAEYISLEDVIKRNYSNELFESMKNGNDASKYLTFAHLLEVESSDVEVVRNFIMELDSSLIPYFDNYFIKNDEEKRKLIDELNRTNSEVFGINKSDTYKLTKKLVIKRGN
ncbi:MAG: hypothetical protein ACI33S_00630 [Bacilli bacterium]